MNTSSPVNQAVETRTADEIRGLPPRETTTKIQPAIPTPPKPSPVSEFNTTDSTLRTDTPPNDALPTPPPKCMAHPKKAFSSTAQNTNTHPFRIFRIVKYTSKTGKDLPSPSSSSFHPGIGTYVFDTEARQAGQATVITLAGEEGNIRLRSLQALDRPWGLPDRIPFPEDFKLQPTSLVVSMKIECKRRGITGISRLKKQLVFERIEAHEKSLSQDLPFMRLTRAVGKEEAKSGVDFLEGEMVFLYKDGQSGLSYVTDYEGVEGWVPSDALEVVEKPWGLPRIVKAALVDPDEVVIGDDSDRGGSKRPRENGDCNTEGGGKKPRIGTRRSTRKIVNKIQARSSKLW